MMRFILIVLLAIVSNSAQAIQLDWNGQFWFDQNWLYNYQLSKERPGYDNDPNLVERGGPYPPGMGEKDASWYSAFFRLKPKLVVNDSIHIRSEFHVGSPVYGFFGRSFPTSNDERLNFTGAAKSGMALTAARYYASLITDFGTIELGRAPIHWGLGAIWNSGDELFDRYQNTADLVRLTSKFGNFIIIPSLAKTSMGDSLAGAGYQGRSFQGNDDITDYDLAAKYDNTEEDFEFGVKWTRRTGSASQKSFFFNGENAGSTRLNYNLFDFYAKKKWPRFFVAGELPYFNGSLGSVNDRNPAEFDYKAIAFILEGAYNSDVWDVLLKAGHVPGQVSTSATDTRYTAVYLNKNYGLGLLMFHYNVYGLGNNNPDTVADASLQSPFDAPIVNANYAALSPAAKLDKWTLKGTFVIAFADETASSGRKFWNYNRRRFYDAIQNQSSFMGWELDLGVGFRWDENFNISWDGGIWFPGSYYEFSNHPVLSKFNTSFMFASQVKAGITF